MGRIDWENYSTKQLCEYANAGLPGHTGADFMEYTGAPASYTAITSEIERRDGARKWVAAQYDPYVDQSPDALRGSKPAQTKPCFDKKMVCDLDQDGGEEIVRKQYSIQLSVAELWASFCSSYSRPAILMSKALAFFVYAVKNGLVTIKDNKVMSEQSYQFIKDYLNLE